MWAPARSLDDVAGKTRCTESERLLAHRTQWPAVQCSTMRDLQPVKQTPRVDERQRAAARAGCDERGIWLSNIATNPAFVLFFLILVQPRHGQPSGVGSFRRGNPSIFAPAARDEAPARPPK
eukprot:scaffold7878_cov126-Isochrysis_galbana.AAC.9